MNVTVNPVEPGLLAPSNFDIGGTQYVCLSLPMEPMRFPLGLSQDLLPGLPWRVTSW